MLHGRLGQRYQAVDSERRRPGPGRLIYRNMHWGQVPDHNGGGLTPLARLKACESPWVLAAGAADFVGAA